MAVCHGKVMYDEKKRIIIKKTTLPSHILSLNKYVFIHVKYTNGY